MNDTQLLHYTIGSYRNGFAVYCCGRLVKAFTYHVADRGKNFAEAFAWAVEQEAKALPAPDAHLERAFEERISD